ncbi:nucleotidyltransferase family protein [uncultured Clostridium sp.]|uniref:nucleotidyltransferase family protein n=1 Tax=uncultured Clostridium sp. TaxID=59620 RepID=UPI0025EE5085|nr:nucleotidyltransferase family protein [uncultured Clostridium sp.]
MKIGAVIVAAGMSSRMNDFKPMMKIDSITILSRVISTLKCAGAEIIVVITGFQSEILNEHLSGKNVVCIYNEKYETTEMFDSAKIGFTYLVDKCDKILFTPADIPLFSIDTVKKIINSEGMVVKPIYKGRGGHPILLDTKIVQFILSYNGSGGLKNALLETNAEIMRIEVDDIGILLDADTQEDFKRLLEYNKEKISHQ